MTHGAPGRAWLHVRHAVQLGAPACADRSSCTFTPRGIEMARLRPVVGHGRSGRLRDRRVAPCFMPLPHAHILRHIHRRTSLSASSSCSDCSSTGSCSTICTCAECGTHIEGSVFMYRRAVRLVASFPWQARVHYYLFSVCRVPCCAPRSQVQRCSVLQRTTPTERSLFSGEKSPREAKGAQSGRKFARSIDT